MNLSTSFIRWFSTATPAKDGLSQVQREAIVDLLYFCMCADQKLLPLESAAITNEATAFSWDVSVNFEDFATSSLQRARVAVASPETIQIALRGISEQLVTTEARTRAITLCLQVFGADGDFDSAERAVFVEIKRAFGWPG